MKKESLQYDYDQDKARRLLAELCVTLGRDCETDPFTIVFTTSSNADMRPRAADALERMLEEVGIEVEQDLEDSQIFFGPTFRDGTWDMGMWAWAGSPGLSGLVSIYDVFDPRATNVDLGDEASNPYRWGSSDSSVSNEETERLADVIEAMNATVDESELIPLLQEAEQILADNVVIIPLFSRPVVAAVWESKIAGYAHNPTASSHVWNIESWYRIDE